MKNPIELLKHSVSVVRKNPKTLLILALLGALVSNIPVAAFERVYNPVLWTGAQYALTAAVFVTSVVLTMLLYIALVLAVMHPTYGAKKVFAQSRKYFWRNLGAGLLTGIVIFAGMLLLIIPGVIFAVMFLFASHIVIYEDKGVRASMRRSKELVSGNWWNTFGKFIALMIIFLGISIITQIATGGYADMYASVIPISTHIANILTETLLMPVLVAYIYSMYQDLRKKHEV